METLQKAIRRTVDEAVGNGSVISISEETKRLAARHPGEARDLEEIAAALTREGLRNGIGVLIGEATGEPRRADGTGSSPAR